MHFDLLHLELDGSGAYGGIDENGRWTGLVGSLAYKTADLSAGGLTITAARSTAIDFNMAMVDDFLAIIGRSPKVLEMLFYRVSQK